MSLYFTLEGKVQYPTMVVSFSGGRTSAFMARLLQVSPLYSKYPKVYLYANTGKEKQETLDFINECDTHFGLGVVWLESVITQTRGVGVSFKQVSYSGDVYPKAKVNTDPHSPFDDLVRKLDIPNPAKRGHCTRDLKLGPMQKYLKSVGVTDYIEAIGIRADEKHRLGKDPKKVYPLADLNIDEAVVRGFWGRQAFDLQLKDYEGNCDLCFKKSKRKRLTIMKENPALAESWIKWEESSAKGYIFDRDRIPVRELLRASEHFENGALDKVACGDLVPKCDPFNTAIPHVMTESLDLDTETDCFCKAT